MANSELRDKEREPMARETKGTVIKLVQEDKDLLKNIDETFTVYRLPVGHHKNMRSTNLLERFNEEIRRRTYVVRVFPNSEACLRLVRALASEQHEEWQEGHRYMNMQLLIEQKKELMRNAA